MKSQFARFTKKVRKGVEAGKAIIDDNGIADAVGEAAQAIGGAAGDAIGAAGGFLDVAAGRRMYNLVQERLDLQSRYNDILAYKLEEALKRIAALEAKLLEKGA
jgi:galactokinase/mevalonate kinase-like predicted kinase